MSIAHVLINCELNKKNNVVENLKHVDDVKEVCRTFGAYDVIAKIENDEKNKLHETVLLNIGKMKDVKSTLTLMDNENQ